MTGFGHDTWWLILAKALAVFVFLVLTVLVAILAERKILGRMQMRWGPNRVGPRGYLQSLADGIKLALKEPITPFGVEKPIFLVAPAISTIPAITAFAFIPFGPQVSVFGHWTALQVTDLPVAVLFILALSSIGVYGIVLAGWASGSTYPLLGGVRSTAGSGSTEASTGCWNQAACSNCQSRMAPTAIDIAPASRTQPTPACEAAIVIPQSTSCVPARVRATRRGVSSRPTRRWVRWSRPPTRTERPARLREIVTSVVSKITRATSRAAMITPLAPR